jgi:hypothetical protein
MVMKKNIYRWVIFVPLMVVLLVTGGAVAMCAMPGKFIRNSATAWVWVAPDQQQKFVDELRDYARQKSLRFSNNVVPAPWKMIGMTILTPKENEISVINATAPDKFAIAITIEHPEAGWQNYWRDFRTYVSTRHKWQDDLKPGQRESSH